MSVKENVVIWVVSLIPLLGFSQSQIHVMNGVDKIKLTTDFLIYEDKTGSLTFDSFIHGNADELLEINTEVPPNKGYRQSTYWVKLILKSENIINTVRYLEIDYPLLDSVTCYTQTPKGKWFETILGDRVPFDRRDIPDRNPIFVLHLTPDSVNTVYLKIHSEGSLSFPLIIWNPEAFRNSNVETYLVFGFYYGIALALILYNLLLFIAIRDRNYLYYVSYVLSFMLLQFSLNGFGFQYLWSNSLTWTNIATPFLIGTTLFLVVLFAYTFLRIRRYHSKLATWLRIIGYAALATALLSFVLSYQQVTVTGAILSLFVAPSVLVAAFIAHNKGYRPAKYFIVAWSVVLVGMVLFALKNLGVVPSNFITNYSVQIGSALDVILLSLALADRINLLQAQLEKNESEKKRILSERFLLARQISIGILHQIRQPLQILKSYLDLLKLNEQENPNNPERDLEKVSYAVTKIDEHLKELERIQTVDRFGVTDYTKEEKIADLSHRETNSNEK